MPKPSVFIIGAGPAGLACASVLKGAGLRVRIADKGRGPGGRCSTRRSEPGSFDHGAAVFTARDERFRERLAVWVAAGAAVPWAGDFWRNGADAANAEPRYVGTPGMNAIIRHEAEALGAEFGLEVAIPKRRSAGGFELRTPTGEELGEADLVVLAVPAPQAAALLPRGSSLRDGAETARLAPCWTLMAAYDAALDLPFDAHEAVGSIIDAIYREDKKPGRAPGSRLVVHADASWSEEHIEDDKGDVEAALLDALGAIDGPLRSPSMTMVHRWRYARVTATAPGDFGLDLDAGFATCGDWHIGPRVEAAWLSGHALGEALRDAL